MAEVTRRYARALADVVFQQKLEALKIAESLRGIGALLEKNPLLRQVWENPAIPAEPKRAVLDVIGKKLELARPLRNFIAILIDHRRMAQLAEITRQFEAEVNQRLGLAEAEVTSARELPAQERRALEKRISKLTGKTVHARYLTDRELLGGAVIRVGSTVYDGSVRGQLLKLQEQLSG